MRLPEPEAGKPNPPIVGILQKALSVKRLGTGSGQTSALAPQSHHFSLKGIPEIIYKLSTTGCRGITCEELLLAETDPYATLNLFIERTGKAPRNEKIGETLIRDTPG